MHHNNSAAGLSRVDAVEVYQPYALSRTVSGVGLFAVFEWEIIHNQNIASGTGDTVTHTGASV